MLHVNVTDEETVFGLSCIVYREPVLFEGLSFPLRYVSFQLKIIQRKIPRYQIQVQKKYSSRP